MSQLANDDAASNLFPVPPISPSHRRHVESLPPLSEGRRTPRLQDAQPSHLEGAGTPRQERFTPRETFFLPNMEPLTRQQNLIFEQAELLREQFMKFAETLQRMHGVMEELREDIQFERQQRQYGEESTAAALASARAEDDGAKRKIETTLRQIEERLLGLREESALRGRAADSEFQRQNARMDAIRTEMAGQISKVEEDNRLASDHLKVKLVDLQDFLHSHRTSTDVSLQGLREEFLQALASHDSKFKQQFAAVDEQLEAQTQQSSSAIKGLDSKLMKLDGRLDEQQKHLADSSDSLDKLRCQFTDGIERVQESGERGLQKVALQASESHAECLRELQTAEAQRLEGQATFQSFVSSAKESEKKLEKTLEGNIAAIESRFKDRLAALEADITRDAERSHGELAAINNLLGRSEERFGTELEAERRHRGISTVGMVTELAALKDSLAQEMEAQHKTESHVSKWVNETSSLRSAMQVEETAHAALSAQVNRQSHATEQLRTSLEASMSASLAAANDGFTMGHQELWHVFNEMGNSTATMSKEFHEECRELQLRTTSLEENLSGRLRQELEEFSSVNGQVVEQIHTLKRHSLQGQVSLTSRLDGYAHDFEKTKSVVDGLAESPSRDFIESPNAQYRLYITHAGDVAVFKRNGWGKHGNDWQGVPRWHAGIVSGDKAVCSVNRDMQTHERDRFLSLANRS